jgi:hypothetical protein
VAARRSQAQAMLTEQAESFITGQYQSGQSGHTGDYPTAAFRPAEQRTGEYRQYRGDAPAAAGQTATGQYPAYGSQDGRQATGHLTQPARAIAGPAGSGSAPATSGWPAQPGMPGGQYEGQRQPQHQRPQERPQAQEPRQAAPLPAMPLSAPVPAASGPATGSSPVAQPGGGVPAKGGLNPYDVAITGSYPYPAGLPGASQSGASQNGASQNGASHNGTSHNGTSHNGTPQSGTSQYGLPQSGVDDPYYRPLPADGYSSGGGDAGRSDPARAGYGAGYANGYQDPRDRHSY